MFEFFKKFKFWGQHATLTQVSVSAELMEATKDQDISRMRETPDQGANPQYADEDRMTALHYAAKKGNLQAVEMLIEAGAPIWDRDKAFMTPLHYAAINGTKEVGEVMMQKAHNALMMLNSIDTMNITPLGYAIIKSHKAIAIAFIKEGADITYKDTIKQIHTKPIGQIAIYTWLCHGGDVNKLFKAYKTAGIPWNNQDCAKAVISYLHPLLSILPVGVQHKLISSIKIDIIKVSEAKIEGDKAKNMAIEVPSLQCLCIQKIMYDTEEIIDIYQKMISELVGQNEVADAGFC